MPNDDEEDVYGGHATHGLLMQRALTIQAFEDEGAQREFYFSFSTQCDKQSMQRDH